MEANNVNETYKYTNIHMYVDARVSYGIPENAIKIFIKKNIINIIHFILSSFV